MRRVILDYKKLTDEVLNLLVEKFPDGYDYDDVISFKNAQGEIVEAIEVRTEDTMYLVKISSKLEQSMEDHDYEEDDEDEDDDLGDDDFGITDEDIEVDEDDSDDE